MINFLLLGYLPIGRMRATTQPVAGRRLRPARCWSTAEAYRAAGGHAAIRGLPPRRAHAGPPVPRAGPSHRSRRRRRARRLPDVSTGFGDGLGRLPEERARGHGAAAGPAGLDGAPGRRAHPAAGAARSWRLLGAGPIWPAALATLLSFGIRAAITLRAGESLWTIPLHPATVATGLAIQWTALAARSAAGRRPGRAASTMRLTRGAALSAEGPPVGELPGGLPAAGTAAARAGSAFYRFVRLADDVADAPDLAGCGEARRLAALETALVDGRSRRARGRCPGRGRPRAAALASPRPGCCSTPSGRTRSSGATPTGRSCSPTAAARPTRWAGSSFGCTASPSLPWLRRTRCAPRCRS